MPTRSVHDLPTPSLLLDVDALDRNLGRMSELLPGDRLRPHVKAHKSTSVARRQSEAGHAGFCCATIREMEGLAAQGLGQDLLLAFLISTQAKHSQYQALLAEMVLQVSLKMDPVH